MDTDTSAADGRESVLRLADMSSAVYEDTGSSLSALTFFNMADINS